MQIVKPILAMFVGICVLLYGLVAGSVFILVVGVLISVVAFVRGVIEFSRAGGTDL
ncbi:hypothetical protein AB0E01_22855 [Nocardia vinacea]|uniref:hypothetical protein n=1 Tax=Nocardia vinacea TaxID=96468 RepID=UPI0033D84C6E